MSSDVPSEFDPFADTYELDLQRGLRFTGATREFFARTRVDWLAARAVELEFPRAPRVLDFGCGDGSTTNLLHDSLGASESIGVDVSVTMLKRASQLFPRINYHLTSDLASLGEFDLVYCSGVFHHIEVSQRPRALQSILNALKPGGIFALWENNPWNPGTRFVMSRVPFDRDAILISPGEGKRLLAENGFELTATDSLFFLPVPFRLYSPLERALARVPLGGQYQLLARRPRAVL